MNSVLVGNGQFNDQNRGYTSIVAKLLSAESYHAALVRTALFGLAFDGATQNMQISNLTSAIAQTRSALANNGNPNVDDHGIGTPASPLLTDLDGNALAFSRTSIQLAQIYYGRYMQFENTHGGQFFPDGFTGVVQG